MLVSFKHSKYDQIWFALHPDFEVPEHSLRGHAEFIAALPVNYSGQADSFSQGIWDAKWSTASETAMAGVLPVTIAGVQGLQGCLWHVEECEDLGEGVILGLVIPGHLSTSSTNCWEACQCEKLSRWWVSGGLHCWWGLCLHLQLRPQNH